jgi:hypothetical protein
MPGRYDCHLVRILQSSTISPWLLKLGIRRELGLYADSVAKRGVHYYFFAWELPVGGSVCIQMTISLVTGVDCRVPHTAS